MLPREAQVQPPRPPIRRGRPRRRPRPSSRSGAHRLRRGRTAGERGAPRRREHTKRRSACNRRTPHSERSCASVCRMLSVRVVLVHGSVANGAGTWAAQAPLAERFELVAWNRPGYPPGLELDRIDFDEQATELAALLKPGDHVCGHSYGGVISLLAAARGPE